MTSFISLSAWCDNFFNLLQNFTTRKNWRIKLIALLTVVSIFLSCPKPEPFDLPQWQAFRDKKAHPFSVLNYLPGTNEAKKNYRLTVPVIAKIFHLNDRIVYGLQFVVTILFLFIALLLTERMTGDKVMAIMLTSGLAFIYTGQAGFVDRFVWSDEFAFLFIILAMYSRKPYVIFCWIQLACWVDERAIIASFAVFIWWKLQELTLKDFSLKTFFRIGSNSSFTFISIIMYFVLRITVREIFHLPTPLDNTGGRIFIRNLDYLAIGLWESLEGFWILFIVVLIVLVNDKKSLLLFFVVLFMCTVMSAAYLVYDITRSAAYMFPAIFIFLHIMKERVSMEELRKVLLMSSVICFIFPCYAIISPTIYFDEPFPIRVFFLLKKHGYL